MRGFLLATVSLRDASPRQRAWIIVADASAADWALELGASSGLCTRPPGDLADTMSGQLMMGYLAQSACRRGFYAARAGI